MSVKKKKSQPNEDSMNEAHVQTDDSGEYGIGQILMPEEADLAAVRKQSAYHFSHDQLEHKEDRIDKRQ